MSASRSIQVAFKALRQLKTGQLFDLAAYRAGLSTGIYERRCSAALKYLNSHRLTASDFRPFRIPGFSNIKAFPDPDLIQQAESIYNGRFATFGIEHSDLDLSPHSPLVDWTEIEKGNVLPKCEDIKFIWEPARFGWAIVLARAYAHTGEQKYTDTFLKFTSDFFQKNPPYKGTNWTSAQEIAIRLTSLAFACSVLWDSSGFDEKDKTELVNIMAVHAARLPITLAYSKAQNNNHLLVESAGMIIAGLMFPQVNLIARLNNEGWSIFHKALDAQIDEQGNYIQQSNNYQRLILQIALWIWSIAQENGITFPTRSIEKLKKATAWLAGQMESSNGHVPNLGPNDGANLFPLSNSDFADHHPTLQAAGCAFLGERLYENGNWDEMSAWFGIDPMKYPHPTSGKPQGTLRIESKHSHAFLRAIHFSDRPGHSDQLHFDLWALGENVVMDAGTYLYNAEPPWNNSLAGAKVHNTLVIDNTDPMTRAGKFLWLDWAQARIIENTQKVIVAEHDGYRELGLIHRRTMLSSGEDRWSVSDEVLPTKPSSEKHEYILQWLLPDWNWKQKGQTFEIWSERSGIWITMVIEQQNPINKAKMQLFRAGELLLGEGKAGKIFGWHSPTYGMKLPALSFRFSFKGQSPIKIQTTFTITRRRLIS